MLLNFNWQIRLRQMNSLLFFIIGVPIIEIYLFIEIGSKIGAVLTIFLILSTAFIGVIFLNFIPLPIFINIPLAVGFGVMFMILFKVTHPPAGGNPIIVIIGSVSFDYLLIPVLIGSIIVVMFGVIINKFLFKKEYPK